nr:hypothetical protein [Sneathiella glossodoripedis]
MTPLELAGGAPEINMPDTKISVREVFGLDSDLEVPAFSQATELVPDLDPTYVFDHDTTMAILAALLLTAVLWFRDIMEQVNQLISNRLPRD